MEPNLVFIGLSMPGRSAFHLLDKIKEIKFDIAFVTGHLSFGEKAELYQPLGYLFKPVGEEELKVIVRRALEPHP